MLNKPQGEVKLVSDTENGHFGKYQTQEKRQNFTSSISGKSILSIMYRMQ